MGTKIETLSLEEATSLVNAYYNLRKDELGSGVGALKGLLECALASMVDATISVMVKELNETEQ